MGPHAQGSIAFGDLATGSHGGRSGWFFRMEISPGSVNIRISAYPEVTRRILLISGHALRSPTALKPKPLPSLSSQRLRVRVAPRAANNALQEMPDGTWKARLTAPPVEGAANDALVRLIADHFALPRSRVRIVAGHSARVKLVEISAPPDAPLASRARAA